MQIELTRDAKFHLTTMLNIELRNKRLTFKYATALNSVFKQLAERDHESMKHREENV